MLINRGDNLMLNSVSFCGGSRATAYQNNNKKTFEKPCKHVGVAIGAGIATAGLVKNRGFLSTKIAEAVSQGVSKGVAMTATGAGFLLGAGILMGVGAFAGKMIGKAIDHFRKPADKSEVA